MTNTNTANTDTNTAVLGTLELQGADIARQWKAITKGDKARFTQHTQADGFDTVSYTHLTLTTKRIV